MRINQSIVSSKSFGQLQKTVDAIRMDHTVSPLGGTQIKIGAEVVDISTIKDKILELYNRAKTSRNGLQVDDYKELASLIFHLKEPDSADSSIKKIYRDLFVADPQMKLIRAECIKKLHVFDQAEASHSAPPKTMKVKDCHTIASLQNLLLKMKEAQWEVQYHQQKTTIPYDEIEQKLYDLYLKEMAETPQSASKIALETCSIIHQLKLMKPRSSKEKTAIDILEEKCVQTIREDKTQFEVIRKKYNEIADKLNEEMLSRYTVHEEQVRHGTIKIDALELSFLAKIVGKEVALLITYDLKGDSLIRLGVDTSNPEEVRKCLLMYYRLAVLVNSEMETKEKLKELDTLTNRLEVATAIQMPPSEVQAAKERVSELHEWLVDKSSHAHVLLLGTESELFHKENVKLLQLPSTFRYSLSSLCQTYAKLLGITLTFDQEWGKVPLPLPKIPEKINQLLIKPSIVELPSLIKRLNANVEAINNYIEFKKLNRIFRRHDHSIKNPSPSSTESEMTQLKEARKQLFEQIEKLPRRTIHTDRELLQLISEVGFYRELLGRDELSRGQQRGTSRLYNLKKPGSKPSGEELFSAMQQVPEDKVEEILKSLPKSWRERLSQSSSQTGASSSGSDGNYSEPEQQIVTENTSPQKFDEDFLNKQVELLVETLLLGKIDQEMQFEMFCTQIVSMDTQINSPNLTGVALSNLQQHTEEINKRVCARLLEHVNRRFNTTEKVFKFVSENYDAIGEKLAGNQELRKAVFEKLDALTEEEMLKEIKPSFTEKHLPKASKFLSALGFKKKSEWAKSIRVKLEEDFYGVLSEDDFRQYMSSRAASQKTLRLAVTSSELGYDVSIKGYGGKNPQRRWMESKERFKRYTKILWEARNNDFHYDDTVKFDQACDRSEYFKRRFQMFNQFIGRKDQQEIFWDTILEHSHDREDFSTANNLHLEGVQYLLREGEISENKMYQIRTQFLKKLPLRKYLEWNAWGFPNQIHPKHIGGNTEILTISVLLLIKSIKTNNVYDTVFAAKLLKNISPHAVRNFIKNAKLMGLLTADEIKTFEENYELPAHAVAPTPEAAPVDTPPIEQQEAPETIAIDPLKENTLGIALNDQSSTVTERELAEQLELMENLEDLEFIENVKERLQALREEFKETPEARIARISESLTQPPSEAPHDMWLELNKRLQALNTTEESLPKKRKHKLKS